MKRIRKFAALGSIAALLGTGIPALAAQDRHNNQDRYNNYGRSAAQQYPSAERRDDRYRNDQSRDFRGDDRWNRNARYNDDRDRDRRGNGYGYQPAPVPVYAAPVYGSGYYEPSHDGRTAAIIGGSAAAGALIGAAADREHGQGAVIGGVIGGIAGAVASAAANHHDRY